MATEAVLLKNHYLDSVLLMQVAQRLGNETGVGKAAALTATDKNRRLLVDFGVDPSLIQSAGPNDLVIALDGEDAGILRAILEHVDAYLEPEQRSRTARKARDMSAAMESLEEANLAVISVPGEYAGEEARQSLAAGLNVFLFSSGLSIDEEIELKAAADAKGLIVMGPDCGTALIAGCGLGFANKVQRGSISVIGSSGTGLQEFTSLVHNAGGGIRHAIGTGSRDLRDSIGGVSTRRALDLLLEDDGTEMICLISKPPGEQMVEQLIQRMAVSPKPIVGCFLGLPPDELTAKGSLLLTRTLEDAVDASLDAIGIGREEYKDTERELSDALHTLVPVDEQRFAHGVFAGGTFCYQAQQIFRDNGVKVASNAPIPGMMKFSTSEKSQGHTMLDMGEEELTSGRPHPMIDPGLRIERIRAEGRDPSTAILLLDFILGWNASPDPCGDLVPAIRDLHRSAKERGHVIPVIASITGTDGDPQSRDLQAEKLRAEGVLVAPSSTAAARLAVKYVKELT